MAYLSEADAALVTAAVTEAEQHTSGEIVTVLSDRSDAYSDIALAWAILAAFTAMAVLTLFPAFYLGIIDHLLGSFTGGWTTGEWSAGELFALISTAALAKFLFVWLIQLWPTLKFLLIPGPIKTARVNARAISLFKVGAEQRTHGRTGIMIYLSMREHRAEIVADAPIAEKVSAKVWGEAMAQMLGEISQGNTAQGIAAGVRHVGAILAEHFPPAKDDENELPDRLIEV